MLRNLLASCSLGLGRGVQPAAWTGARNPSVTFIPGEHLNKDRLMIQRKPLPSAEELCRLFIYDPETGSFKWRRHLGREAGFMRGRYRVVNISGEKYQVGRLIWKMMTGIDPVDEIDHRNCDAIDDRWSNLREATRSENEANKAHRKVSAFKGVSFDPSRKRPGWYARIKRDKKSIYLGYFNTAEEAYAAYCEAARILYGEHARVA